ncbi:hypothetical protein GGF49_003267 [Coemansia sp. RSA 1853]|nr:hypothetical protein GGF49_003267 [Coemansia sp. RSA 1853]
MGRTMQPGCPARRTSTPASALGRAERIETKGGLTDNAGTPALGASSSFLAGRKSRLQSAVARQRILARDVLFASGLQSPAPPAAAALERRAPVCPLDGALRIQAAARCVVFYVIRNVTQAG